MATSSHQDNARDQHLQGLGAWCETESFIQSSCLTEPELQAAPRDGASSVTRSRREALGSATFSLSHAFEGVPLDLSNTTDVTGLGSLVVEMSVPERVCQSTTKKDKGETNGQEQVEVTEKEV